MLYRVEGIVIRSTDYGEGNKIVTLLTSTHGKMGVVVRGARKPKSKFGAAAQLFTYGDYSFFKASGGLGTLNYAEILDPYRKLREGLDGPSYAAYAVELTDRALADDEAGSFVFHQLKACLSALAEGKDPQVVLRLYEMKIVHMAGYMPILHECANCGRREGKFRFSPLAGGALCDHCIYRDQEAIGLDDGIWKLLRLFETMDMRRLGNIVLKESSKQQLKQVLRRWMDMHLGLQLKSRNFLDQLERHGEMLGLKTEEPRRVRSEGPKEIPPPDAEPQV
jgi:DNA repair protein RecO (recombination protein O)